LIPDCASLHPGYDPIHLSNSPTQTASSSVQNRLHPRSASVRRENAPANEASNDFAYCPVKSGSNEREHDRDHKKYRRPEQQIVAIE
jgi:hypothetical protein